jgi:hypothetical protein
LFTVLGHDHIVFVECGSAADDRSFLADALHVETEPALALGGQHALVQNPGENHGPVYAQSGGFFEGGGFGALIERAILLQQLKGGNVKLGTVGKARRMHCR